MVLFSVEMIQAQGSVWGEEPQSNRVLFLRKKKLWGPIKLYWYDYPKQHFYDDGARQDDALQDHFPEPEQVKPRCPLARKQLQDCVDAGLDFIIPVYWGNVSNYFSPGVSFSIYGLPPLQEAIEIRGCRKTFA